MTLKSPADLIEVRLEENTAGIEVGDERLIDRIALDGPLMQIKSTKQ